MEDTTQDITDGIDVKEAARRLGFDPSRVRQLLAKGRLIGRRESRPGAILPVWVVCAQSVAAYPLQPIGKPGRPRGATGLKPKQV